MSDYEDLEVQYQDTRYCEVCGNILSQQEIEFYEATCEECVYEQTAGLIHDYPEAELE